jgi:hypothetical protein
MGFQNCRFLSSFLQVHRVYQVFSLCLCSGSDIAECYLKLLFSSAIGLHPLMAPSLSPVATSFGLEPELKFALYEDQLVNILKQRHLTRSHIVKEIPTAIKKEIGLRNHGHPPLYLDSRLGHRGWVLRIDRTDSSTDWQSKDGSRANVVYRYRTYWSEPLYVLKSILRHSKNYTIDVALSTTSTSPRTSFEERKVVNDHSLVPAGKAEMNSVLEDCITEKEVVNWDNTGSELVTPIMHRLGNGIDFDEIRLYLERSKVISRSNFGIFPSKYGALHLHVGFADSADRFLVLQHLAFIMLQYEHLLTKLFPLYRNDSLANLPRGLCQEDTKSNQDRARMHESSKNAQFGGKIEELGTPCLLHPFGRETICDDAVQWITSGSLLRHKRTLGQLHQHGPS